jgi:response regulator RpfG family c-di-GMP phosphodiesterase
MAMSEKPRILCVDDEENILSAIQRSLRRNFTITTATSGKEGLQILKESEPFEVVVSDMKMPEMSGAVFLRKASELYPHTVRVLLTGYADLDNVVAAVNDGHIYRFLGKPITGSHLLQALEDSVAQHRLLTAEKVLLEKTLKGSIQALTEILSLANPAAFGRGTRISQMAMNLARRLRAKDLWQVEVAAMLSQIGCITLPHETAMKWYAGEDLSPMEEVMVAKLPEMTRSVLGTIPRLEPVMEILDYQNKNFDGSGPPEDRRAGEDIPLGSRILRLAIRVEDLQSRGATVGMILDDLKIGQKKYDPEVWKAYQTMAKRDTGKETIRGVTIHELRSGMIFSEAVKSKTGIMLVAKGQECTGSILERIQNYDATVGLRLPMWVENPEYIDPESEEGRALLASMKDKEPGENLGVGDGAAAFLEVD